MLGRHFPGVSNEVHGSFSKESTKHTVPQGQALLCNAILNLFKTYALEVSWDFDQCKNCTNHTGQNSGMIQV